MATTAPSSLMRHGKSSYPEGIRDHERPLAERGLREARIGGEWIRENVPPVDAVLCSTSRRTVETLATRRESKLPPGSRSPSYCGSPADVIAAARTTSDHVKTLLIVGHEPGIPWDCTRSRIERKLRSGPTYPRQVPDFGDRRPSPYRCRGPNSTTPSPLCSSFTCLVRSTTLLNHLTAVGGPKVQARHGRTSTWTPAIRRHRFARPDREAAASPRRASPCSAEAVNDSMRLAFRSLRGARLISSGDTSGGNSPVRDDSASAYASGISNFTGRLGGIGNRHLEGNHHIGFGVCVGGLESSAVLVQRIHPIGATDSQYRPTHDHRKPQLRWPLSDLCASPARRSGLQSATPAVPSLRRNRPDNASPRPGPTQTCPERPCCVVVPDVRAP